MIMFMVMGNIASAVNLNPPKDFLNGTCIYFVQSIGFNHNNLQYDPFVFSFEYLQFSHIS